MIRPSSFVVVPSALTPTFVCGVLLAATAAAQTSTPPTPPRAVGTNAPTDTGADVAPVLIHDGVATWTCVYETDDATLSGGGDRDVVWIESRDDGVTWTVPQRLATAFGTDTGVSALDVEPTIAFVDGKRLVAWATTRGSTNGKCGIDFATAAVGSSTWSAPQPILASFASDAFDDRNPSAVGSAHRIVVAWEHESATGERDIRYARTQDEGVTWDANTNLLSSMASDTRDDRHPCVATTGGTNFMVVYDSVDLAAGPGADADIFAGWSSTGAGYSGTFAVNSDGFTDTGDDTHPSLAIGPGPAWYCVWQTTNTFGGTTGGDLEIAWSKATTTGLTFSPPAILNADFATDGADDSDPHVSLDTFGRLVVTWSRRVSATDSDILMTTSADAGVTWSPIVALNTNAATDSGADTRPVVATDGVGHSVAVWQSTDSLGGTIGTDGDILRTTYLTPHPTELSTPYCYGNVEAGNPSTCPCGNDSPAASRRGCANSSGTGADIVPVGAFTVVASTRFLRVTGVPPGAIALCFQGTSVTGAGLGTSFGDGRLCVGGSVRRFNTAVADANGTAVTMFFPTTQAGVVAGDLRFYQGWYRDAAAFCTASTFNLSSACAVVWVP